MTPQRSDPIVTIQVECNTAALAAVVDQLDVRPEAVAAIESDPVLQELIERFDGQLVQSSIVPIEP